MNKKPSSLNFANFLSITRLMSSIPLIYCLNGMYADNDLKIYSILIIFYIFLSDILDGFFARKANFVTDFGKIIDPVADKICLIVVLIYLIDIYQLPFLIFFIFLSIRDCILLMYSIYLMITYNHVTQANTYGKLFIFCSLITLILYVYKINVILSQSMYYVTLFMLVCSTIKYIKEHRKKIGEYEHI